jgi:Lon protease-like protein
MSRALPAKPNLHHLKSQAKELLEALRRGETQAFSRIRAVVPAFAHKTNAEIARGPFALHDAQSAIAREYGCVSWAVLRDKVAASSAGSPEAPPGLPSRMPPEVQAALLEAAAKRGSDSGVATPLLVPLLPLRNSVVFPGSLVPIDATRPSSLLAVDAARATTPAFLAIFAQRAVEIERPTHDDLHPTGTLCVVRVHRVLDDGKRASFVVEGVRWITLEALERTEPYYLARVADLDGTREDDPQIAELHARLRALGHRIADAVPNAAEIHAAIDGATEPEQLADLAMGGLPTSVEDRAAYAEEALLVRKLERAIAAIDAELAKLPANPPG